MKTLIGIYQIKNTVNGSIYIGSAVNFKARFSHHLGRLRNLKHKNQHLQNAWNKYGEKAFEFIVLLICEPFELLRYEQELINKLNPEYNICKYVKSKLGWITPESVKQKIRDAQIGKKRRPHTEEEKLKISAGLLNSGRVYNMSPETKDKIKVTLTGRTLSDSHKNNISKGNTGRVVTAETRIKISESNKITKRKKSNYGY